MAFEILVLEGMLVLEEMVVHVPEATLRTGRFGRDRRPNRERVNLVASEMTKNEACIELDKRVTQRLQLEVGTPAMRTLELAVFNESHGGLIKAENVVIGSDRRSESWEHVLVGVTHH
jgi:hypothetical protein